MYSFVPSLKESKQNLMLVDRYNHNYKVAPKSVRASFQFICKSFLKDKGYKQFGLNQADLKISRKVNILFFLWIQVRVPNRSAEIVFYHSTENKILCHRHIISSSLYSCGTRLRVRQVPFPYIGIFCHILMICFSQFGNLDWAL